MLRIITALVIAALLGNGFTSSAQSQSAEIKFKREIVTYGTNQNIKLVLASGEKLEGRIAEIRNDSFTLQLVNAAGEVVSRDLLYGELSKVSKVTGRKAAGAVKRGFIYGAGFYLGMLAVSGVALLIAAAVIK